jgi:mannose-6-phosphate isomerase-like protein (cupin superfamily)
MQGFVRKATEGDARWFYGNLFVIKAGGPDTGGRFSLIDCTSPPGFEPGTHIHPGEAEAFYVLEGTLHGRCGTANWSASAGDLVFIPPDTPHNFTVAGEVPARYLVINSPPGFAAEVAQAPPAQTLTLPPPGA